MAFTDTFLRLQRLAYLIQRKSTGSPQQLADKLGVSVRTVDNLLNRVVRVGYQEFSLKFHNPAHTLNVIV